MKRRSSSKHAPFGSSGDFQFEAPSFQNWSCDGCGDCCRGSLLVEISPEEKRRIEAQGWNSADGISPEAIIHTEGGRFHLGHQSSGACIFLDNTGRCRIHTKFGEEAKPLACRSYPIAIHPAGSRFVVGLRFSCSAAARNHGQPLSRQLPLIQNLASLVVPKEFKGWPTPAICQEPGLEWDDFLRYVKCLDRALAPVDVSIGLKLARSLHWLHAIAKAGFDHLSGSGADEILEALAEHSAEMRPSLPLAHGAPSLLGKLCLRLTVLECARATTASDLSFARAYRWRLLWALWRFTVARGKVPIFMDGPKAVTFAEVEGCFGPLPEAVEATLTRYVRVKLNGLHFCGRAFHDFSLIEGFQSLALTVAAILWISRGHAVAEGRSVLSQVDVEDALRIVDHPFGAPGRFVSAGARQRVRLLARRDDIAKLCCWYAR